MRVIGEFRFIKQPDPKFRRIPNCVSEYPREMILIQRQTRVFVFGLLAHGPFGRILAGRI